MILLQPMQEITKNELLTVLDALKMVFVDMSAIRSFYLGLESRVPALQISANGKLYRKEVSSVYDALDSNLNQGNFLDVTHISGAESDPNADLDRLLVGLGTIKSMFIATKLLIEITGRTLVTLQTYAPMIKEKYGVVFDFDELRTTFQTLVDKLKQDIEEFLKITRRFIEFHLGPERVAAELEAGEEEYLKKSRATPANAEKLKILTAESVAIRGILDYVMPSAPASKAVASADAEMTESVRKTVLLADYLFRCQSH